MAFARYTGKSGGTIIKYNNITLPGWRKITIEEKSRTLPTPLDVTAAQDSVYTFVDDPLGGKSSPSCTVTVEGFLSVTDAADGATGILQFSPGDSYTLLITTKTSGDEWTQANMVLKTFTTGTEVAAVMPYTMTFSHATLSGAWSTDAG